MYSCTHNTRLDAELIIHKSQGTRLILAADMSLCHHEATLHGASKLQQFSEMTSLIPKKICVYSTTPGHKPKTIPELVMQELPIVLPESTDMKFIVIMLVDVSVQIYTQIPLHV